MRFMRGFFLLPFILLLAACQSSVGPASEPDGYHYYGKNGAAAREGVIQDIQYNVIINNSATNDDLNTSTGVKSNNTPETTSPISGSEIGLMMNYQPNEATRKKTATLYIVKIKDSATLLSVIQPSVEPLCIGDEVYLINDGEHPELKLNENYYLSGGHSRQGCLQQQELKS